MLGWFPFHFHCFWLWPPCQGAVRRLHHFQCLFVEPSVSVSLFLDFHVLFAVLFMLLVFSGRPVRLRSPSLSLSTYFSTCAFIFWSRFLHAVFFLCLWRTSHNAELLNHVMFLVNELGCDVSIFQIFFVSVFFQFSFSFPSGVQRMSCTAMSLASCSWSTNLDAKLYIFPAVFSSCFSHSFLSFFQVFSVHMLQFFSSSSLHFFISSFLSSTVFRFSAAEVVVFAFWEKAPSLDPSTRVASHPVPFFLMCTSSFYAYGTTSSSLALLLSPNCFYFVAVIDDTIFIQWCQPAALQFSRRLVFRLSHSSNFRCVLHCPVFDFFLHFFVFPVLALLAVEARRFDCRLLPVFLFNFLSSIFWFRSCRPSVFDLCGPMFRTPSCVYSEKDGVILVFIQWCSIFMIFRCCLPSLSSSILHDFLSILPDIQFSSLPVFHLSVLSFSDALDFVFCCRY